MTTDENDRIPHPCRGGLIFHGESHHTRQALRRLFLQEQDRCEEFTWTRQ